MQAPAGRASQADAPPPSPVVLGHPFGRSITYPTSPPPSPSPARKKMCSCNRAMIRPHAVEFLVHMGLAAVVASVQSLVEVDTSSMVAGTTAVAVAEERQEELELELEVPPSVGVGADAAETSSAPTPPPLLRPIPNGPRSLRRPAPDAPPQRHGRPPGPAMVGSQKCGVPDGRGQQLDPHGRHGRTARGHQDSQARVSGSGPGHQ